MNKNKDNSNFFINDDTQKKFNLSSMSNLPIISKKSKFPNLKNIFKKIGAIASAMLLFGTSTSAFATTQKDGVKKENNSISIVENIENNFKNNYKYINKSKTTEERIEDITNKTGNCQEVKDILTNCVKEINENYDKNSFLVFGDEKRESKEEYINNLLNTLENDIKEIYYINKDDLNNDKKVLEMLNGVRGKEVIDKYGNKKIYIVSKNGEDIKDNNLIAMTTAHEISHVQQKINSNNGYIGPQSSKLILSLREGLSVFEGMKSKDGVIQRDSSYLENENIYIKLAYIIGEEKLKNYINTESNIQLDEFLTDSLDDKYGKGTGEKLLNELIRISPYILKHYSNIFSKNETKESVQKEIDYLNGELVKEENINKKAEIEKGIKRCQVLSKSLENIKLDEEGLVTEESVKNSMKEFEKYFSDTFVEKKISSISSQKETVNELKEYYAYKKLGQTNNKGEYISEDINDMNFQGMNIDKIEKNLYDKCVEYGVYKKDEDSFKLLLKSSVYDLENCKQEKKGLVTSFTDGIIRSDVLVFQGNSDRTSKLLSEEDKKSFKTNCNQLKNVFDINLIKENINKGEEK